MNRRTLLRLGSATALAWDSMRALAAPNDVGGPVRLVVGFQAGSVPDALARQLAAGLEAALGATVIVENRPGAGGTIGVDHVARSAPDGRTLVLSGDAALVLSGGSYGMRPPYRTLDDLAPLAQVAVMPNVLLVTNAVPAHTVQELVALVRSQPGRFSYTSAGIGLSQHRAGELLNAMAGLDMVHVPGSASSAMPDLVSGRVQVYFANIGGPALALAREGKVRALAVSSLTRSPAAPELPTLNESGLPGFESVAWFGLLAPAGTPPARLRQLEAAAAQALAAPAMTALLKTMGAEAPVQGSEAFARVIRDDIAKWAGKGLTATASRP